MPPLGMPPPEDRNRNRQVVDRRPMEPCRQNPERLSAYIDGELAAEERRALEEHLTRCEACRREVEVLRALREAEVRLPLEPVSSAEWERVWSGVERSLGARRGVRRRGVRWRVGLLAGLMSYRPALAAAVLAAAMVLAGFAAIVLYHSPSPPPDETFAVARNSDLTLETIAYDCENYTLVVKAPKGEMAPILWLTPAVPVAPSEDGS